MCVGSDFSGPLSRLITSVVTEANRSRTDSHHWARRSTRQSLVTFEVTAYTNSSSNVEEDAYGGHCRLQGKVVVR